MEAWLNAALFGLVLLTVGAGLTLGGRPEKLGAAAFGIATVSTWGVQGLGDLAPVHTFMAIDFSLSLAFGVIALRHPAKLWPGVAGCFQFLVFVFSATRAIDYPLSQFAYIAALSLCGIGVMLTLLLGTLVARYGKARTDEWETFAASFSS